MSLTNKQEQGLKIAVERYKHKEMYTTIAGYAGTGKTFLAKKIIEALNLKENEYLVGSFTGKASLRLQQGGFPNALTLHKMLFRTFKDGDNFRHIPLARSHFSGIKLILIDEISMVPDYLLRVAANLKIHIIMLGDNGQLPPIGRDNGMLENPHIMLDEIVRQAEDNSIILLSHKVRTGEIIQPFNDEFVQMFPKEEVNTGMLLWADQVLCAKNDTRRLFNKTIRNEKGFFGETPEVGEKIIVTANDWDFLNEEGNSLVNGLTGIVTRTTGIFEDSTSKMLGQNSAISRLDFTPEFGGSQFDGVKYDALPFITGEESKIFHAKGAEKTHSLDFGYVITTHKAQGSEYDKVLGIEEILKSNQHRRWLYTLITRAKDKITLLYDINSPIWDLK